MAKSKKKTLEKESEEQLEATEEEAQAEEGEKDELTSLREELEAAQAKAEENLDGWQRALAEFANYKKRIERENTQIYQDSSGRILKRFLEVIDDMGRALEGLPQEGEGAEWAEGVELIYRKLLGILENEGVTVMETEGQPFDPNFHEAISNEESEEHESGEIIEVIQKGYMLGGRVLRPARVRVAS